VSLNFNGFFIYVLSAPVFLMQHLGLGETGSAGCSSPG
jgi:DHA1 family bicyclomycin/chloramphenicol resistance-like MFS transporter